MILAGGLALVSGAAGAGLIAVVSALLTGSPGVGLSGVHAFLALASVSLAARIGAQVLLVKESQSAVAELRMILGRRILATPLRSLESLGAARLLAALTDDVTAISDAVGGFPFLIVNAATVLGCLAYMGWLSFSIFAFTLLAMLLGVAGYRFLEKFALRALLEARAGQDDLFRQFRVLTEGTKELLLHRGRRLDFVERSLAGATSTYRDRLSKALSLYAIAGAWAQCLLIAILGFLVFLVPRSWANDPGVLTSFGLTLLYMVRPMDYILQFLPVLGRARVGFEKLSSLGLILREETTTAFPERALEPFESLEIRDVVFAYEQGEDSFRAGPFSATFAPREIVFITGGNGSGKSTLGKLITGLYTPLSGGIRLNGKEVDANRLEELMSQFSVIFSDFFLFDRLYPGGEMVREEGMKEQIARLRLEGKVQVEGIDVRSSGLSQGQKKRLALLCAWAEDRPVYLFDEWAADQEPGFREIFYTRILPELKERGKLVIVISHDDRYFGHADRILRMESGRILEIAER
ncbi:MAG: cyclic peptide export ABC transporter [Planctomycetota bacterium]